MVCFYHSESEASAVCGDCGKYLCSVCAAKYTPCLCTECAKSRSFRNTFGKAGGLIAKSIVFWVISSILFYLLLSMSSETEPSKLISMAVLAGFIFSGVPWGWSLLSRLIPISAFGNIAFVLVFYLIKFMLAYFIGFFVMAFNLLKILFFVIKGLIERKQLS